MLSDNAAAFIRAVPIWAEGMERTKNLTCAFVAKCPAGSPVKLKIAASTLYRLFVEGEFKAFGPARAGHGCFRVDEIDLPASVAPVHICVEVAGYNNGGLYVLDQPSFLQAEAVREGEAIVFTGRDFDCYLMDDRLQKVLRFSYQRAYCESYRMSKCRRSFYLGDESQFRRLTVRRGESGKLLPRGIPPYGYEPTEEAAYIENGLFEESPVNKTYRDRQMYPGAGCDCFLPQELELDANAIACTFRSYRLGEGGDALPALSEGEYALFWLDRIYTGFLKLKLSVFCETDLFVTFDETVLHPESGSNGAATLCHYRNETCNVITYRLAPGEYDLTSFEPYGFRYLKCYLRKGRAAVRSLRVLRLDNPEAYRFSLDCGDERIQTVFRAAQNTLSQCAVDVLIDGPNRERAGWLGDVYFLRQAEELFTGWQKSARNTLENVAYYRDLPQIPAGLLPGAYPAEPLPEAFIPNYSLTYLIVLRDYCRSSGDGELAELSRRRAYAILGAFRGYENAQGLLENPEGWIFLDWSAANCPDFTEGVNYPVNFLYAAAIEAAGQLYADDALLTKAERIRSVAKNKSFRDGFFRDSDRAAAMGRASEACQYYAAAYGGAVPADYPDFFRELIENFGVYRNSWTNHAEISRGGFTFSFVLRPEILLKIGQAERAAGELLSLIAPQAAQTGTVWEHEDERFQLNNGFGSAAAVYLARGIFGYDGADRRRKELYAHTPLYREDFTMRVPVDGAYAEITQKDGLFRAECPGYRTVYAAGLTINRNREDRR